MRALGWDIGGANLKASDDATQSQEQAFPLWKQPEQLASALAALAEAFEPADLWAVSMTGELADCFRTKREGVERILQSVVEAAAGTRVVVWTTAGEFVPVDEAIEWPLLTAASNWLALATWVGRMAPHGHALLIDVGSTTTDIIPIRDGFPDPLGRTDVDRLRSGELVYTGWRRTPVIAMASDVIFRGQRCPLAAELFATALDVHLLAGNVAESEDCDTANSGPATVGGAHDRLARMLCCDREEMTLEEALHLAIDLADQQLTQLTSEAARVVERMEEACNAVIVAGSGSFLARSVIGRCDGLAQAELHSLTAILGDQHATAACAFALARLAVERIQHEVVTA